MVAHSNSLSQPQPASGQGKAESLLAWYDCHARILPWRVSPSLGQQGKTADPYRVWLSEVMLQQTNVQAVKPYFEAFTLRWPSVDRLAAAPAEEIMKMWAGLGYYSRARNLHACSKEIISRFGGLFPADEASLITLPGVGVYTAAAISAIAFGRRAVVVDGNVERVITRLHALDEPLPQARPQIRRMADQLTPAHRPGDFAQAMMDLGATLCTPRKPDCGLCPFQGVCAAQKIGTPEAYPRKIPKPAKITRFGVAFVALRKDGALLVRTRPPKGLLGGMTEIPGTDWTQQTITDEPLLASPLPAHWVMSGTTVRHVFTHFPLELRVYAALIPTETPAPLGMRWISANEIAGEAFPTLFRKVIEAACIPSVGNLTPRGETPAKLR
ncbi:MAG: A/G-specific adenine glycosylase [Beijerinckiaceae bacterium]